jgi:hypothetical protein
LSTNAACRCPPAPSTTTDLLRRHLKVTRSRWRILPPEKIAAIVLAVLRHDQRLADMAGGNNVSESTVRRWRDDLITLLAAQAPRLHRAPKRVDRQGGEVVVIHGTLIATQRRTRKSRPAKPPARVLMGRCEADRSHMTETTPLNTSCDALTPKRHHGCMLVSLRWGTGGETVSCMGGI